MISFYDWLLKYYSNSDSPAGDLARDMARDAECPTSSYTAIKKHIIMQGGCAEAIQALDEMWVIYKQCFPGVCEIPIKDFHGFKIPSRLASRFRYNGIKTLEDVMNLDLNEAREWRGAGAKTLVDINSLRRAIEESGVM